MLIRAAAIGRTILRPASFIVAVHRSCNEFSNLCKSRGLSFCSAKIQTARQQPIQQQSTYTSFNLIPVNDLATQINKDLTNSYRNYHNIKSSFTHHLSSLTLNHHSGQTLIHLLSLLKHYPSFPLNNTQLLQIYKTVCLNLHLKSVEDLNHLLQFVLIADQSPTQSPIFLEFIKFYVQVPVEYYKTKYEIDFERLSLVQALKQFIGRSVQRGFFPRSPPYTRNLNVLEPVKIVYLLSQDSSTQKSLMVKKLNYTIFMDIKTFYQQEMHQNLYHHKKVQLMKKFTSQYMQVIAKQIPSISHQVIHLRELYMKLYLTLPQHNQSLQSYSQINQNLLSKSSNQNLKHEFQVLKLKNAIYLYNLARHHLKRIDHLKLQEVTQNIGVVIEFVQQFEKNIQFASQLEISSLKDYQFEFKQIMQLLTLMNNLNLTATNLYKTLINEIQSLVSPLIYYLHFDMILDLIKTQTDPLTLIFFIQNPDHLQQLSLKQLSRLSQLIQKNNDQKLSKVWQSLFVNILNQILSTDFEVVGGQQIVIFLHIFQKGLITNNNQQAKCQSFRVFILRYVSDHHQQFSLAHFQQILNKILDLPDPLRQNFDDSQGNYPHHILHQLDPYLTKVLLLLSQHTRHRLQTERQLQGV